MLSCRGKTSVIHSDGLLVLFREMSFVWPALVLLFAFAPGVSEKSELQQRKTEHLCELRKKFFFFFTHFLISHGSFGLLALLCHTF